MKNNMKQKPPNQDTKEKNISIKPIQVYNLYKRNKNKKEKEVYLHVSKAYDLYKRNKNKKSYQGFKGPSHQ